MGSLWVGVQRLISAHVPNARPYMYMCMLTCRLYHRSCPLVGHTASNRTNGPTPDPTHAACIGSMGSTSEAAGQSMHRPTDRSINAIVRGLSAVDRIMRAAASSTDPSHR